MTMVVRGRRCSEPVACLTEYGVQSSEYILRTQCNKAPSTNTEELGAFILFYFIWLFFILLLLLRTPTSTSN